MRVYRLTASLTLCPLILLIPLQLQSVQGQNYFEYNIHLRSDGSAVLTITQFSNANATIETFDVFQQKVFDLVDSAAYLTHREMTVDENSLQINTTISSESKTTEYSFVWQNFSLIQGSQLSFGDVFQVNNFFGQLYGDAALELTYPTDFTVESVSPAPYERQDSAELMKWSRTQDLVTNKVNVVLTSDNQDGKSPINDWQLYAIVIAVLTAGLILAVMDFFKFKRRKNNAVAAIPSESPLMSEEDKIIKLLKLAGSSMRQSEITEQSRFSKAKTSQLLTSLEKKGSITRYKNGRDKIVTLKERMKGDK
jgi:uncharacterized membrane protein